MSIKKVLGFGLLAAIAGALFAWQSGMFGGDGAVEEIGPRQWPFDPGELRQLMDHVIEDQHQRIDQLQAGPAQQRAKKFLSYYEGRKASAVGS